ncbi:MAG: hypothetical protein AAGK37_18205 [Pseudomonadota bacterium]
MARFSNSNRAAEDHWRVLDLRRPGIVRGGLMPAERGPIGGAIFYRDAR